MVTAWALAILFYHEPSQGTTSTGYLHTLGLLLTGALIKGVPAKSEQ
jgi:hypothetical protein